MKKFILFSVLGLMFFACVLPVKPPINPPEVFVNTLDTAFLWYKGRSSIGISYQHSVIFFKKNNTGLQQDLHFLFNTSTPEIENGVYTPPAIYRGEIAGTFTRSGSYYRQQNGNYLYISDGTVTIEKKDNIYTFIIDVTDEQGNNYKEQYRGGVLYFDDSGNNPRKGMFVDSEIHQCNGVIPSILHTPTGLMNFVNDERLAWLTMSCGDNYSGIQLDFAFSVFDVNDISGTYNIEEPYFYRGVAYYKAPNNAGKSVEITSGSVKLTRVFDEQWWKFRIEVNITNAEGNTINEEFNGGSQSVFGFGF